MKHINKSQITSVEKYYVPADEKLEIKESWYLIISTSDGQQCSQRYFREEDLEKWREENLQEIILIKI